jgi:hypothetical protein
MILISGLGILIYTGKIVELRRDCLHVAEFPSPIFVKVYFRGNSVRYYTVACLHGGNHQKGSSKSIHYAIGRDFV